MKKEEGNEDEERAAVSAVKMVLVFLTKAIQVKV
jgi:hypothetical protein